MYRKNALLIQIGSRVKIVWDNVDSMNGSWDTYLSGIHADFFAGADDITNEREPGIGIIEHTP